MLLLINNRQINHEKFNYIHLFPVLITAQDNELNEKLIKKVFNGLRLHLLVGIMKELKNFLMNIYTLQLSLQMEAL